MICPQCGKELPQNAVFCGDCGASLPAKKEKKPFPFKIVLCALLAVSLLLNLFFLIRPLLGKEKIVFEGKGYNSPEEAITAYAEAFRDGDVDKMISTFAIESYVDNFDPEKYTKYLRVYTPRYAHLPSDSLPKERLNCYSRVSDITEPILCGYYTMLEIETNNTIGFSVENYEEEIEEFFEVLEDPNFSKKLSRIEIGDVLTLDDFDLGEKYEERFEKKYAYLNFDELQELAIEIEMNGDDYYLFMLVGKVDGKWYNISLYTPLGSMYGLNGSTGGLAKK